MMDWVLILAGLAALTLGAELLVRGASSVASRLGVSSFVIGLTIVGFGTSTPELGASVTAALRGVDDVAVGNVIGSNIFNIGVILGLTVLLQPMAVKLRTVRADLFWMMGAAVVPLIALATGVIGPITGVVMLAGLAVFLWNAFRAGRQEGDSVGGVVPGSGGLDANGQDVERAGGESASLPEEGSPTAASHGSLPVAIVLAVIGLALLTIGSRWLVTGGVGVSRGLGVSELTIGLTIVAAGTSAPELVTSLMAGLRGRAEIALGNVIGSNIFNILGILSITALVSPQTISLQTLAMDIPVMLALSLVLAGACLWRQRLGRVTGVVLLVIFGAYMAALLTMAPGWFG